MPEVPEIPKSLISKGVLNIIDGDGVKEAEDGDELEDAEKNEANKEEMEQLKAVIAYSKRTNNKDMQKDAEKQLEAMKPITRTALDQTKEVKEVTNGKLQMMKTYEEK